MDSMKVISLCCTSRSVVIIDYAVFLPMQAEYATAVKFVRSTPTKLYIKTNVHSYVLGRGGIAKLTLEENCTMVQLSCGAVIFVYNGDYKPSVFKRMWKWYA